MSIFKRPQRKYVKKAYRVRNWREYEAGLRNRGSLTVWISLTAASRELRWMARSTKELLLSGSAQRLLWCTTPIEAQSSLGLDSHHPIISLSGIPSAVMVLRILHPILASTLCAANPLARIAEPTIAL